MTTSDNNSQIASPFVQPGLLIAGCGYLGSLVASQWLSRGGVAWALTRSESKARQLKAQGIEPLIGRFSTRDSLPLLPATSAVLWSVGYDRSQAESRETIWVDGLARFLRALPQGVPGRRVIAISSTAVYGDAQGGDVDERTEPAPMTASGRACLSSEATLLETLHAQHPDTIPTILRLGGIYGPGRLLRRVDDLRRQAPLTAEPEDWLNLIHVDDAARLITALAGLPEAQAVGAKRAALTTPGDLPTVINVACQQTFTRRAYYAELARRVGAPAPIFESEIRSAEESSAVPQETAVASRREFSGNKRVTSCVRPDLPGGAFQFENPADGLADACRRSDLSPPSPESDQKPNTRS